MSIAVSSTRNRVYFEAQNGISHHSHGQRTHGLESLNSCVPCISSVAAPEDQKE